MMRSSRAPLSASSARQSAALSQRRNCPKPSSRRRPTPSWNSAWSAAASLSAHAPLFLTANTVPAASAVSRGRRMPHVPTKLSISSAFAKMLRGSSAMENPPLVPAFSAAVTSASMEAASPGTPPHGISGVSRRMQMRVPCKAGSVGMSCGSISVTSHAPYCVYFDRPAQQEKDASRLPCRRVSVSAVP